MCRYEAQYKCYILWLRCKSCTFIPSRMTSNSNAMSFVGHSNLSTIVLGALTKEGRKEVFPWTVIGLLFLLWTVNCVLFSSWTVNWPPLIFSVIRELSFIFFVNRELESFIFPVIRDWPLFFFREPWILPIIFVNFLIPPPPKIHMSFIVMIRNWFLMIDIDRHRFIVLRNVTTVSDHILSETKLRIMAQCLHIGLQERLHTRFSKGGFRGGGAGGRPPPFSTCPPLFSSASRKAAELF